RAWRTSRAAASRKSGDQSGCRNTVCRAGVGLLLRPPETQTPVHFNRRDVAARLRGLLAGQDAGIVGGTAERLGVDEISLRMSIDPEDPRPTIDVLLAVVL